MVVVPYVGRFGSGEAQEVSWYELCAVFDQNNVLLSVETNRAIHGARYSASAVVRDGETVGEDVAHHGSRVTAGAHYLANHLCLVP